MQAHNTIASQDSETGIPRSALGERAAGPAQLAPVPREDINKTEPRTQDGPGIEFLSNLAHQLRSPLSSLRVWVDLLGDPAALASPEGAKRLVDGIDRATSRLERQISDVLEVGYLQAGTVSFEKVPVDAGEQLALAAAEAEHAARSRRISIDLRLNDRAARVLSTETRLRQIAGILLSNAIRFSPVDGTITVTAGSAPHIAGSSDTTTILEPQPVSNEAGHLFICISDNGPGIPSGLHHNIFLPFQRAVRKDAHGGGGSGLGLAIAVGLIKLHSGGIWLRSNPGSGANSGAEFEFSIPRAPISSNGPEIRE